jgi:hypothetical protein
VVKEKIVKETGQTPWLVPLISATWEAEIGKIAVQGQLGQKVRETPIFINKPHVVLYAGDPSYMGGIGKRISV